MDLLFELNVTTAPKGSREVSSTLYRQIRSAILEGRLRPGSRLPSTRNASLAFGVSRNTAQDVYERLTHEGLLNTRQGSGTYVSSSFPREVSESRSLISPAADPRINDFWTSSDVCRWMGFWGDLPEPEGSHEVIADLRPGLINQKLFPHATFRQVMARELRRLETRSDDSKNPQGNQGAHQLRQAIAGHIALTRTVPCEADDIIVTSGAQQAFDLLARTLVRPGETIVAVEDPGYPPMRVPFAAAGAKLAPVKVDAEGIVVDEIPPGAAIVCVCPSHQFPLGVSMSRSRRQALLAFAERTGALIVEDDYDGEFRYEGSPVEAFRSNATSARVCYVGSFSKCMFPTIRLGFMVPPAWALPSLIAAKNGMDWYSSAPLQMAVAGFILGGHLARHLRRMRRAYSERRDLLLSLLKERLPQLDLIPSFYGVHIAAISPGGIDCEAVSHALARRGVMIHALDRYYLEQANGSGFLFSYAKAEPARINRAVEALAEEIEKRLA